MDAKNIRNTFLRFFEEILTILDYKALIIDPENLAEISLVFRSLSLSPLAKVFSLGHWNSGVFLLFLQITNMDRFWGKIRPLLTHFPLEKIFPVEI